jgi:hypothetical protein
MSRSLLVCAAISLISVAGAWIHSATRDARPVAPNPPLAAQASDIVRAPAAEHPSTSSVPSVARPPSAVVASRPATAPSDADREPPAIPTTAAAAMRVAIDPATGQLVDPEPQGPVLTVDAMQALARQQTEGLITIRNPDGSETLNHEGRFADFIIVRAGPDGRPVLQCAHGPIVTGDPLRGMTPATAKMEDR